jgi:hypothetical protein
VGSVGLGVTGVPEIRNISNDENLIIWCYNWNVHT